jgi:hypothetical protein
MIKQLRSSTSFGAKITAAGGALWVARDLHHPVPFQVNQNLANPVTTAACRTYRMHPFGHSNSPSKIILISNPIIIQPPLKGYRLLGKDLFAGLQHYKNFLDRGICLIYELNRLTTDPEFHNILAKSSRNPIFVIVEASIMAVVTDFLSRLTPDFDGSKRTIKEHGGYSRRDHEKRP